MTSIALFARTTYRKTRPAAPRDDIGEARVCSTTEAQATVERIVGTMAQRGYNEQEMLAVRLALDEAIANAIQHGNRSQTDKHVRIDFDVSDHRVLLQVEDEGDGFEPESLPDPTSPANRETPRGRGVYLMRHFMTWVRYNSLGNCVTMCRLREATPGNS